MLLCIKHATSFFNLSLQLPLTCLVQYPVLYATRTYRVVGFPVSIDSRTIVRADIF